VFSATNFSSNGRAKTSNAGAPVRTLMFGGNRDRSDW
jgi:hypothetical protein